MLELTYNLKPDPKDDLKFKRDDGLERRVKAVLYTHGYEDVANEVEATKKIAEWAEEGRTGVYPMYQAKNDELNSLAPQLMARLIQMHKEATSPGGSWPPEPPQVEESTAKMWAGTAAVNPLQEPMNKWYKRCSCMPEDPDTTFDNKSLVDQWDGKPCTHYILGAALMNKLKKKTLLDGSTLYKSIKGKGRSDAPIYAMLARVQMGDPPILILNKEKALGGQVNVIFGIEPNQP